MKLILLRFFRSIGTRARVMKAVFTPMAGILPWPSTTPRCTHSTSKPILIRAELPVELWLEIIELVLRPSFALDETFQPHNLQFFSLSLLIHQFSNPYLAHARLNRRAMRLVSRSFKTMVDQVATKLYSQWILSYSRDNATTYPPCIRLDTKARYREDLHSGKPYPHPVQTLCLQDMPGLMETRDMRAFISGLISRSSSLTVLHVSFMHLPPHSDRFPLSMLESLSSLQTLSIGSHGRLCLNGPLLLPNLANLFLTCEIDQTSDLSEWRFPSLQTLSIDTRGWPQSRLCPIIPQYCDFIGEHRGTIRSLRIIPFSEAKGRKGELSAHIAAMPGLESLATDFSMFNPFPPNGTPPPSNFRCLIHVSTSSWAPQVVARALVGILERVSSIDTLALTEDPFLETQPLELSRRERSTAGLKQLHAICESRKITVYGNMGAKHCCVPKAMEELGSLRMDKIQAWYSRGY